MQKRVFSATDHLIEFAVINRVDGWIALYAIVEMLSCKRKTGSQGLKGGTVIVLWT
jgi:hypothetical protein